MEGLSGQYVEINGKDYKAVYNKIPPSSESVDRYVPPASRIYLIRVGKDSRDAEKKLNKELTPYPFSNTPPINILDEGKKYVDENIESWIAEAIIMAEKQFVSNYKGARL